MTALSVFGLSFGLPAFALVKTVLPAFYARQDTKTPVRAGVASLIANMLFNVLFLAILYVLWVPSELQHGPLLAALSKVPGLHFALGLASALASYLNLAMLWRWLRRAGVYDRQPGWAHFLLRLLVACVAMTLALLAGLHWAPDFTAVGLWSRVAWLAVLVAGGAAVYFAAMLAMGFRLRDLREH
jgi:putative peptidoglycan lipid II flippase